jgi:pyruvate ferredoxin oxidoreductase alpha subunit
MSACVGASAAGARVMTATSANGLALMWEIVYIAASLRCPIVMSLVNRALSGPINIHCDHSDVMGMRDAGWIILFSENGQEAIRQHPSRPCASPNIPDLFCCR